MLRRTIVTRRQCESRLSRVGRRKRRQHCRPLVVDQAGGRVCTLGERCRRSAFQTSGLFEAAGGEVKMHQT